MALLARSSRRYLARHPWLTALSIVGVALGVAVVVAVDLANVSAGRAFALSGEAIAGKATHRVVGGPGGVPTGVYRDLRRAGVTAAPVVEGWARPDADTARVLQVVGVDPLANAAFVPYLGRGSGLDMASFLTVRGAAVLAEETAAALGVGVGDTLRLRVAGRPVQAVVVGILQPADRRSRSALTDLLAVDVATAQAWFGMVGPAGADRPQTADRRPPNTEDGGQGGRGQGAVLQPGVDASPRSAVRGPRSGAEGAPEGALSHVDLLLDDEAAVARVRGLLPEGVEVQPAASQTEALATMTRAFRLNLQALALLALVVGLFLIYNTATFAVVQRRRLLGTYRALGVTRREVFRVVLGEAVLVGAVGAVLGLVVGVGLGQGLVRLVTRAITDLYFVVRVRELALDPAVLVKGLALGVGATVLAALAPAWEAASTPPATALARSSEEDKLARRAGPLALIGLALAAAGGGVLFVPAGIGLAYVGMLLVIAGSALAAPWATRGYARLAAPLMGKLFGPVGRMAARGVTASLSRTAVAVAALAVAVAATVGVGVMVRSFRATVAEWLESALVADVYVQPPPEVARRGGGGISPELAARLAATPGVVGTDAVWIRPLTTPRGTVDLAARELTAERLASLRFKSGGGPGTRAAVAGGAVLVSEPYAYRFDVAPGDTLDLPTDRGRARYPVAGVFYDYGNDLGVVMMDLSVFRRSYEARGPSGLAFYAAPGVEVEDLVARVRARAAGEQRLAVRSNRALRASSLALFDRTFLVTSVLRLLAVGVAFVGVLSALMALMLERKRELAVLRAQGMTPGEVGRLVTLQTALLGLWAGLLSLPLGLALAAVLVYVVNRRSFGWTLHVQLPPDVLLGAVGLALAAALLAGLYPAWRMGRTDPALAVREE